MPVLNFLVVDIRPELMHESFLIFYHFRTPKLRHLTQRTL